MISFFLTLLFAQDCGATINKSCGTLCCSQYNYCGITPDHCGTGCQDKFGTCGSASTVPTVPATQTCGNGKKCEGSLCCSKYNYCGSTPDHCGVGCQGDFGSCTPTTTGANNTNTTTKISDRVFAAYYTSYSGLPMSSIPNYITHLNYAFGNISPNGTAIPGETSDIAKFANLNQLKLARPHLKTLLSIGGWSNRDTFNPVMSNKTARAIFVKSSVGLMLNYKFDGLDVDWEYPSNQKQGTYYVLMLKELRAALKIASTTQKKNFLLTSAVPASSETLANFILKESAKYLDWFYLMGYDASVGNSKATNQSPLYTNPKDPNPSSSSTVVTFMIKSGVSPCKIVFGLPLYGRQYNVTKNDPNNGLFATKTTTIDTPITNKDISKLISIGSYTRYYDTVSEVPYLYNAKDGLFVTYDDTQSAIAKVNFANKSQLRGIFFWELNQDFLLDHLDIAVLPAANTAMLNVKTATKCK